MAENTDSYNHGKYLSGPTGHVLPISSYQIVYHPPFASLETALTAGPASPWYLFQHFSLLALTVSFTTILVNFQKVIRINMSHTVVVAGFFLFCF